MAVYVDPLMNHGWKLGKSCHMMADSLEELHELGKAIGLKRSWFQCKLGSIPHYDLTESKRNQAIALGVIELKGKEIVEKYRELRSTQATKMEV